jgi:hypothetical protein
MRGRGRSTTSRRLLVVLGGVLLCALASAVAFGRLGADTHNATPIQPRDQTFSCGGPPNFPRSALSNPLGVEKSDDPAARAMVRFVRNFLGVEFPLRGGWRELVRTPDMVLFGGGTTGRVTHDVLVEKVRGSWEATGGGGCTPTLVVPGYDFPTWILRRRPTPNSKTLRLVLETGSCHPDRAGADARGRFDHVEASQHRRAIRLIFFERKDSLPPGTVCAGVGISYRINVRLPNRIGRRALRNAATAPSTLVRYDKSRLESYRFAFRRARTKTVRARMK